MTDILLLRSPIFGATRRRALLGGAALGALLLGPASALAQTDSDSPSGARSFTLEEITVTARKREESAFETPTALSVFSSESMKVLNISNLDDVGKYVPNLNINRFGVGNPSQAAIFIRGIGLQDHLIVTDPGVSVYLDGVYLGRQMGSNLSLQNIERVEVLRGPQGTLYGRNSIGGAVNIITRQPGDEETVELSGRLGTRERAEFTGYGNFRLADNFALSMSGALKRRDGVGRAINLDNPSKKVGEENEINGRIAAKWDVSDSFRITASLDGTDFEGGQSPFTIDILSPATLLDLTGSSLPAGVEFFGTPLLTPGDIPDRDDLGTNVAGLEDVSSWTWGASLTFELDLDDNVTAKFLASYRDMGYTGGLDDDDTIFNLSEFPEEGGAEQVSLELQVNATFEDWDLVAGAYYFNEDGFTFSGPFTFAPFNNATPSDFFDINQETNSFAFYANGTYHVTDRLSLGGGVRYSRDEKDADSFFPGFPAPDFESASFDAITAEASATYALSDKQTLYATIQRGYQTGGFPPRVFVGGPDAFEPFGKQTALNYEVGFKGDVTDWWRVSFAAFWTVYNDLALNVSEPQAGGFLTLVRNAGESRTRGIEFETQISLASGFFFNGSLGVLDAEITKVDPPEAGSLIPISEGDEPALTPTLTASFVLGYRAELENGGLVTVQTDYSYRGAMFGQAVNILPELLDHRTLVGFNAQYESADGSWTVDVYGENIFNKVYDQGRLINSFHGFVERVLSNDRSEFGVRFTKRFAGL
ncbi:MAG: TonB-dependent receptor [Rhodothalassiaceae bacterium]